MPSVTSEMSQVADIEESIIDVDVPHEQHTVEKAVNAAESGDSSTRDRPNRNRKLSELGKQNRITTLSVQLTRAVNRDQAKFEQLYKEFESLDTPDAVDSKICEVNDAAQAANDMYDELFVLCDNKLGNQILSLFDQYIHEVKMIIDTLSKRNEALNQAARIAAEEEEEVARMEASIEEMKAELDRQMRIHQERKEARDQQRLLMHTKLQQQSKQPPHQLHETNPFRQPTGPSTSSPSLEARSQHFLDASLPTPARNITFSRAPETSVSSAASSEDRSARAIEQLASTLVYTMKATKRSTLEPPVFKGSILEFADWEIDFDAYVESEGLTGLEPLRYLKKFVGGDAKECIEACFSTNTRDAYEQARRQLRERFGKKHSVARAMRARLDEWPGIKPRDGKQLQKYADFLNQVHQAMKSVADLYILNDRQENEKLARKLPDVLQFKWAKKVRDARKADIGYPDFGEFAEFVDEEADLLSEPILERASRVENNTTSKPKRSEFRSFSTSTDQKTDKRCLFCHQGHLTGNCLALEAKPYMYEERVKFFRDI
jgi:hypothetical protein